MRREDDFPQQVKEELARRVGYRCSNPKCQQLTSGPQVNTSKSVNVGVASHIAAASINGPRYDESLSPEQRRHAENGIWLCQTHGKLVDNDANRYPEELLREWKRGAEQRALDAVEGGPGRGQGKPQLCNAPSEYLKPDSAGNAMSPELHEATAHLSDELGALYRLVRDYCAALDCLDHNDRRARQLAASEQVLGEWRERNRRTLPAILERLRAVRMVRPSAVVIGDRSRKSALAWLVELGERARDWILCNDSYLDQLDVLARWLVGELGIDRERLFAEVGVELEQLQGTASTEDRLHIDDIENFAQVRSVQVSAVAHFVKDGRIEISEEKIKLAIEEMLQVPFHHKDRPNELDDIYTANVIVKGSRRPTAFMLKGPGIRKKEMTIADCGKNGDQLVRLFDAPADLFVVQFVGRIAEMVVKDVEGKTAAHKKRGKKAQFLIVDGQDTARLLFAYGKLSTA